MENLIKPNIDFFLFVLEKWCRIPKENEKCTWKYTFSVLINMIVCNSKENTNRMNNNIGKVSNIDKVILTS